MVLQMIGWELDESQAKIIPDDPVLAAEMMQKEALAWMCPACTAVPVVNMALEDGEWQVLGNTQYVGEDGEATEVARWVVGLVCDCGEGVYLAPDDYYLIAGEALFYEWEGFVPLQPEQICGAVDNGIWEDLYAQPLGSEWDGKPVPPHMRGLMCMREEEEEE